MQGISGHARLKVVHVQYWLVPVIDVDGALWQRCPSLDIGLIFMWVDILEQRVQKHKGTNTHWKWDPGLFRDKWVHLECSFGFRVGFVHLFRQLKIEKCYFVVCKMRCQSCLYLSTTIQTCPLRMVIFMLTKLTNGLTESLSLFKAIKFERLIQRIKITWIIPSNHTSSFNNVSDFCLIHLFKFFNTLLIKLSESTF